MSERKEFGDPTPEELDKLLASLEEDIELSDMLEEQKQKVLKQEKTKITIETIRKITFGDANQLQRDIHKILKYAPSPIDLRLIGTGPESLPRLIEFIRTKYINDLKPTDQEHGDWSLYVIANEVRKRLVDLKKYHPLQ
jgi:hypothetical protein